MAFFLQLALGGYSPTRPDSQEGEVPLGTGGPPRDPPSGRSWGTPRSPCCRCLLSFSPFPVACDLAGRGPLWAGHPEGEEGHRRPSCLQCRPSEGPDRPIKGPWTLLFCFVLFFFLCCLGCVPAGRTLPPLWTQGPEGEELTFWVILPPSCRYPRGTRTPGGSRGLLGAFGPLVCCFFCSGGCVV